MPRRKNRTGDGDKARVAAITYAAKRTNIPPAGLEAHGVVRGDAAGPLRVQPHLPPALRFSPDAATATGPRVSGATRQEDGHYVVEVEGMDVYDPAANEILPTDRERIAAWFVDTDYDGRTFCICQAFFPDKGQWKKLAKALGGAGLVDEGAFDALSGLRSVPFPRPSRLGPGERWRVAVKVIDPRGNEGLRVLTEGGAWA